MTRKWIGIVVFVLVLCLASPAAWAKDVTIAVLVPLTGAGAFYGKVMRDIATGVIGEINSKGGVKGFGEMKYRVYDTATDPAVTASMIERAHSQGATFLWGGFSSSVESMMVKKANELKIPCLLTNEHTFAAIPCDNKYAITPVLGTMEIGKICAKYFKEKGVKTYAIIGADYVYGRTWEKSLQMALKGTGTKQVYANWHSFKKVDYTADIVKLKALKPDAVVRSYGGAGEYVIVKQMKDAKYWPSLFIANCTMAGYQVTLDKLGPEYVVGVTAETCQNPNNPRWIEFAKNHKKNYGCLPTWLSQGSHDTLWVAKLAVEKSGSLDPEKIAKAMHDVSYNGVGAFPCGPFESYGYVRL
jgi:branched-chain amino acid transport system substrate-binding protein